MYLIDHSRVLNCFILDELGVVLNGTFSQLKMRHEIGFSVISFKFYRFCRFYRIPRELKNSKMLPSLVSEPRQV